MTKKVEIYTGPFCYYCKRAIFLLDKENINYTKIDLGVYPDKRKEMVERSNGKITIPQIFIDMKSIGGFDELNHIYLKGELHNILKD